MLKGRLVLAETLQCLSFNMPRELLLCILMRICTYVCGHVGVYTCIQVLNVMVQRLRNNRYISNGKKSKHSESKTMLIISELVMIIITTITNSKQQW